jgi:hypothetical protein
VTGTVLEGFEPFPVDRVALGVSDSNADRELARAALPDPRVGRCGCVRREDITAFHAGDLVKQAKHAAKTRLRAARAALASEG